jgi:hypothetical protein
MLPQFPLDTRETISGIIDMIGREVTFYNVVSLSGCYACSLDPISNTSTDSYCQVCSGAYWIPTYSGTTVKAHVTFGSVEDKDWATGGMVDNGEIQVKFMHTPAVEELVQDAKYFVVDGREMDVRNVTLRGVPEVNRILVKLKEKERG